MSESKDLEILVSQIQKQLSPDAEVLHNVRLPSRTTSATRQIDVLVRQRIGQYEMTIVIDSKDYKNPVDVKGVEEFYGLVTDVGANKGVLVCPAGFTKAAKERAKGFLIDLYSLVDTGEHKWKVKVSMPTICDFRSAKISFGLSFSDPLPFSMPYEFYKTLTVHDRTKKALGQPLDIAIEKWNKGLFPVDPGDHKNINPFDDELVLVDNGQGVLVNVRIRISLHVEQQLYYGQMPISKISGFRDEDKGHILTNAFEVGLLDPSEIVEKWQPVLEGDDLPMKPGLRLRGLVGWG
jgi:hypothetical protein